jgi:WD40 repeat protein
MLLPPGFGADSGTEPVASAARSEPARVNSARLEPPPKLDRFGDPLPPGAIARLGTLRFQDGQVIKVVAYSPDGKLLASSSGDAIHIWDVPTGRQLYRLSEESHDVKELVFSPDSKMLAHTIRENQTSHLVVREVETGRRVHRIDSPKGEFGSLCYSPDGEFLAASHRLPNDEPSSIKIYNTATFEQLRSIVPWLGDADLWTIGFLPASPTLVLSGKLNPAIQLWDVALGKPGGKVAARGNIRRLGAISRDGKILAVGFHRGEGGLRGAFQIGRGSFSWALGFNRAEREIRGEFPIGRDSFSWALGVSRGESEIRLLDVKTGQEIDRIAVEDVLERLTLTADGKTLASWSRREPRDDNQRDPAVEHDDGTLAIQLWDASTGPGDSSAHGAPPVNPWVVGQRLERGQDKQWVERRDHIALFRA